mmetsp:Transcript_14242/g.33559  ORF Transcript_14242/g.33559 Transcript_14242/m.33559 type:complete len:237 (-) Transcript_14242:296-1006(-)
MDSAKGVPPRYPHLVVPPGAESRLEGVEEGHFHRKKVQLLDPHPFMEGAEGDEEVVELLLDVRVHHALPDSLEHLHCVRRHKWTVQVSVSGGRERVVVVWQVIEELLEERFRVRLVIFSHNHPGFVDQLLRSLFARVQSAAELRQNFCFETVRQPYFPLLGQPVLRLPLQFMPVVPVSAVPQEFRSDHDFKVSDLTVRRLHPLYWTRGRDDPVPQFTHEDAGDRFKFHLQVLIPQR